MISIVPDVDWDFFEASESRLDNSVGVFNLHSSSPLGMIEESVVVLFGLFALIRRYRKNLALETEIHKNEFFVLLQIMPWIASEVSFIKNGLVGCGSRMIASEANNRTVMINPEKDVEAIATMAVVVVGFRKLIKHRRASKSDHGAVT